MNSLQDTHRVISKKELKRGEIISQVLVGGMTIRYASEEMSLSYRQARRLVKKVKRCRQEALAYDLRGKASLRSISPDIKDRVVSLYRQHYADSVAFHKNG